MGVSTTSEKEYGAVAFVILHYMSDNLTRDCIDSVLRLNNGKKGAAVRCVVVDNASGNGSLERLLEHYGDDNQAVHFIANPGNLGFSRANNIGYRYARDSWDPDFIIVANNDIQVTQADFLDALGEVYREKRPYLIGPDIYCERLGFHQSPMNRFPSMEMARDMLDHYMKPDTNGSPRDVLKHLGYGTPGVRSPLSRRRRSCTRRRTSSHGASRRTGGRSSTPLGYKSFITTMAPRISSSRTEKLRRPSSGRTRLHPSASSSTT